MTLYVGDAVRVSAHWSEFFGMCGTVTATNPTMVLLEDYTKAIRIDEESLVLLEPDD